LPRFSYVAAHDDTRHHYAHTPLLSLCDVIIVWRVDEDAADIDVHTMPLIYHYRYYETRVVDVIVVALTFRYAIDIDIVFERLLML